MFLEKIIDIDVELFDRLSQLNNERNNTSLNEILNKVLESGFLYLEEKEEFNNF